jgi:hypothetical protein
MNRNMGDLYYIKTEDVIIDVPGSELITFPPEHVCPLTALDPYWFRQYLLDPPLPQTIYISNNRYPLELPQAVPEPSGVIAPVLLLASLLRRRVRRADRGGGGGCGGSANDRAGTAPVSRGAAK